MLFSSPLFSYMLLSSKHTNPSFSSYTGLQQFFPSSSCLLRCIFSEKCCAGFPLIVPSTPFSDLLCGLGGLPTWMVAPGPFAFWLPIELGHWGALARSRRKGGGRSQVIFHFWSLHAELSAWFPAAAPTPCHTRPRESNSSQLSLTLGYFHIAW